MTSEILWIMTTAIAIFFVALLFGNVVLLNLLIAIVSDEFDQFMERAGLEAQLAVASICREARDVMELNPATRPDLFPRQLYVLRAKSSEVPEADEWAGKVKAVVNVVRTKTDALETKMSQRMDALEAKTSKMDAKLDEILAALTASKSDNHADGDK
jgi:hypothetical protein